MSEGTSLTPRDAIVADLLEALEQIAGFKPIKQPAMWRKLPADVARDAISRFKKATGGDTRGEANPPSLTQAERSQEREELLQLALPIVRAADYVNLADNIERALKHTQEGRDG